LVSGGRFTPPPAPQVGLYESTDGGNTFSLVFSQPSDGVDPGSATGNDFFRGGASHVELYRASGETQVYVSLFDYGIYRRSQTIDGDSSFHQVFGSAGGGTVAQSSSRGRSSRSHRTAPTLRIYTGDSSSAPATFWKVDNANIAASSLFNDGGIFRLDGSFTDTSGDCASRGLTGNNLIDCQHWPSKIPRPRSRR
jgi:hypothetical protein